MERRRQHRRDDGLGARGASTWGGRTWPWPSASSRPALSAGAARVERAHARRGLVALRRRPGRGRAKPSPTPARRWRPTKAAAAGDRRLRRGAGAAARRLLGPRRARRRCSTRAVAGFAALGHVALGRPRARGRRAAIGRRRGRPGPARTDPARGRGAAPARRRPEQQRDRRAAGDQRSDRRAPPRQRLRQDRRPGPVRGARLRAAARASTDR